MTEVARQPVGTLQVRTIAMPSDTNPSGDIFGGWIMSQMDIAGGILSKEISGTRTVTIAVETMKFIRPVKVGDVVSCYGMLEKIGTTSMRLQLEVWVEPVLRHEDSNCPYFKVTEADFTYVAIDQHGKKTPIVKHGC